MILYLDTSAAIKLYVQEVGHELVWDVASAASAIATCLISYAEMRAAFARLRRENRLSEEGFNAVKAAFDEDWEALVRVQIEDVVLRRAGDLADAFALRGYDSVQLAAADHLRSGSGRPVLFASFDRHLNEAASFLGCQLLDGDVR
jgi:predicted nucleic acid-binding protein